MGTDKRKFLFHKAIFFTTEQNKTSISLDWRKLLIVIYLLRIRVLKTFFKKWQNQAFLMYTETTPFYYGPDIVHSWLYFCYDFHPKEKKVRCTCSARSRLWEKEKGGGGEGGGVRSFRPLDKGSGAWSPKKFFWPQFGLNIRRGGGWWAPQDPPLDPPLACIILSTCFVVQASSILCVMAEH